MANRTKAKSGDDTAHYHAWRSDQADDEVTALHKVGPAFETRRAALSWLRDRCGELAKVLICRDAACPALDLGDDMPSTPVDGTSQPSPSPEPAPPRTPQPGGSPF